MSGVLLVGGACLLWALDTLFRYPLLFSGTSAWTIVWLEHAMLLVCMLWWMIPLVRQRRLDSSALTGFLVIGGLGSALGTVAFTQAFGLINPSVVILIQKLQPVVAVSLAALVLREQISARFILWFSVCLLGSLLLAWPDMKQAFSRESWGGRESNTLLLGYGCTLFAVVAWGASTVFGKRLGNCGFSPTELMAGRFTAGFIVLTPLMFIFGQPSQALDATVSSTVVKMVLISGLAGMWLYYLGMQRLPARVVAIAELLFPVFAVLVNWHFLDASLAPVQLVGTAILLLGSTLVALTQVSDTKISPAAEDAPEAAR